MSTPVEETLAWEAEQRPRASTAAMVGGAFTLFGSVVTLYALRDFPTEDDGFISVTEAISARLQGNEPREASLLAAQITERIDQAPLLWLGAIVSSIAVMLAMFTLVYLWRATKARAPETTSRPGYISALIAAVFYPIGHLVSTGAELLADKPSTADEAREIYRGAPYLIGETLQFFGNFATGLAFVLVALNAMRVGLLTRFMGVLGIIVGVLAVVQLDLPQLIRSMWLLFVGAVIAGRLRNRPPAWETGRAMPWPSQQQIREARQQADLGTNVPPSEPDSPVEKQSTAAKRKRKKRR